MTALATARPVQPVPPATQTLIIGADNRVQAKAEVARRQPSTEALDS